MSEFQNLTLSNALNLLKKGEITAVNLTEYYLNKIHNSKKTIIRAVSNRLFFLSFTFNI